MNKIGIFLAYQPKQSISHEGIGRLLAYLLNATQNDSCNKFVLACPKWYLETLHQLLIDLNIDPNKFEYIHTKKIPIWVKLLEGNSCQPSASSTSYFFRKLVIGSISFFKRFIVSILSQSSFILAISVACLLGILFLVSLPFVLVVSLLLMVVYIRKRLKNSNFIKKIKRSLQRRIHQNRILQKFKNKILTKISNERTELKQGLIASLRHKELKSLAGLINRRREIKVWYIPCLFWPEIKYIRVKKIIAAPDVVLVDFPTFFISKFWQKVYKNIEETVKYGDAFICYSEHVKNKHLVENLKVDSHKIHIIPHGANLLSQYLVSNESNSLDQIEKMKVNALKIINDYQSAHLQNNLYLKDFNFASMHFMIFTSQVRYYKNHISLIKAYEILLRKKYKNFKLIITGRLLEIPLLYEYVIEKRLEYDIISLPDVPAKVLAALNCLAICSVNPTLFEGGFPFTFTEAYSVGTPSLMSKIPAVLEQIKDEKIRDLMIFDPYNLNDIVHKMSWAIDNAEILFREQRVLYNNMVKRDWTVASNDYISLFNSIVS